MIASPPNPDGSVDLEHEGHHFHIMADACSYGTLPDGGSDPSVLRTPEMTCTICGQTARAFVPLTGDHAAQLAHAYFRLVLGLDADLPTAVAAVIAAVQAAGGVVRVRPNDRT